MVVSTLCGTIWYSETVDFAYEIFSSIVVMALGFGYATVGKFMLRTLLQSGNQNSSKEHIIYKIVGFIVYYGVVTIVGLVLIYLHVRNHIYTVMICSITHGSCLMVTFVLLFFRTRQQIKNKSPHQPPGLASRKFPQPLNKPSYKSSSFIPSPPSLSLADKDKQSEIDKEKRSEIKQSGSDKLCTPGSLDYNNMQLNSYKSSSSSLSVSLSFSLPHIDNEKQNDEQFTPGGPENNNVQSNSYNLEVMSSSSSSSFSLPHLDDEENAGNDNSEQLTPDGTTSPNEQDDLDNNDNNT